MQGQTSEQPSEYNQDAYLPTKHTSGHKRIFGDQNPASARN